MFTGIYPALPTMAFFLVGMWLATLDLRARATVARLLAIGLAMAVIGYGVGWNTDDHRAQLAPTSTSGWRWLSAAGHSQMPAWIVGSTGLAIAVIGTCLWVTARLPQATLVLAHAGQLALTFYIVHVFLLRRGLREWPWHMSPPAILAAIAGLYAGFVVIADQWRRRRAHGPAEAILRFADSASHKVPV
jgi:uncharacterized membrane protein YeiB